MGAAGDGNLSGRDVSTSDVRNFVPEYNSMAGNIVSLLHSEWPKSILDVGSGAGYLDIMILDNVPTSRIDCVEISPEMVRASVSALGRNIDRAEIIHKDVMDFNPEGKYDAVITNLLLHTMAKERKAELLARIRGWLADNGLFIWGDFVEGGNETNSSAMHPMLEFFRRSKPAGSAPAPEESQPLSTEEMIKLAGEAGFAGVFVEWKRGSFAVLSMRKG